MISIILPPYNETNNIKLTVPQLLQVLNDEHLKTARVSVDDTGDAIFKIIHPC